MASKGVFFFSGNVTVPQDQEAQPAVIFLRILITPVLKVLNSPSYIVSESIDKIVYDGDQGQDQGDAFFITGSGVFVPDRQRVIPVAQDFIVKRLFCGLSALGKFVGIQCSVGTDVFK